MLAGVATAADGVKPAGGKELEAWWVDLEKDELEATRALLNLADRPAQATSFLKEKLKPLSIDSVRVKALLLKLGNASEKVWKSAFEELEYFDPRLAIDLQELMERVTETPARERMVEVLSGREAGALAGKNVQLRAVGGEGFNFFAENFGSWWAEHKVSRLNLTHWGNYKKKWTRAIRAIVLLEHIGTPEAAAIIKNVATGHADAQPTKVAKQALERQAKLK